MQHMLVKLQENLAVYTFHKKEKELSPNFNLHAKVSSQNKTEVIEEKAPEPVVEVKEEVKDVSVESKILSAMSVGVNDKFQNYQRTVQTGWKVQYCGGTDQFTSYME